jgi:hypothetical protein
MAPTVTSSATSFPRKRESILPRVRMAGSAEAALLAKTDKMDSRLRGNDAPFVAGAGGQTTGGAS